MRLRLATVVVAGVMTWAFGVRAEDSWARLQQANDTGKIAGSENLNSGAAYFDRARKLGFPAAGQSSPYVLKAEFTTRGSSGTVETGTYTDTWVSDSRWRRDAALDKSRFVRARNGKKRYRLDDGPDASLLQFVLTAIEPIPATDSFKESDWKITHETVDGVATIRVARGKVNADGTPDAKRFEGYWFDETGQLVKTYSNGLQTRRSKFEDFNGVHVARQVEVMLAGKVGMRINVTGLGPAGAVDSHIFAMKGYEWTRVFASEDR